MHYLNNSNSETVSGEKKILSFQPKNVKITENESFLYVYFLLKTEYFIFSNINLTVSLLEFLFYQVNRIKLTSNKS